MRFVERNEFISWPDEKPFFSYDEIFGASSGFHPLDASGEKFAWIVRCPKDGTLDKFEFRLAASDTWETIRCSFQDVGVADGFPDETIDEYRDVSSDPGADSWVAPGLITDDGTDTGTKRVVSAGEFLACVVEFESTVGDIGISTHRGASSNALFPGGQPPYCSIKTGTWAYVTGSAHLPIIALKYDDGTYPTLGRAVVPATVVTDESIATTSTPDEVGNIVNLPFPARVIGGWHVVTRLGNNANNDLVLYGTDGSTVLASGSADEDVAAKVAGVEEFWFDPVDLKANQNYRIVTKPTVNVNTRVHTWTFPSAGVMGSMPNGTRCYRTERTDAGSWTDTALERVWCGLYICPPAIIQPRARYQLGI